jgi:carbon monoxide dehydrogenase subunit G
VELNARYVFPAPPLRVWELLMDPHVIASCLPGSEQFDSIGDDHYRVVLRAGVAAITGSFEGTVILADKQSPVSYRLIVEARGRSGFVKGESTLKLADDPEGTAVEVAATAHVGGLIAQVGQRLLGATARMMMDRFFRCMMQKVPPSADGTESQL